MTGYSAVLLLVRFSPGTGVTSTLSVVLVPNGGCGKSRNVTVFVSPELMMSITARLTIGWGLFWIVSVTGTWTSWLSPEFSTVTSKARSVDAGIGSLSV